MFITLSHKLVILLTNPFLPTFRRGLNILSLNRLEKIYWIKDALQDPNAILKKAWDSKKKDYHKDRRAAIVKGNYVIIIRFTGLLKAKLVTAFEKNDIENIINDPDFERSKKYFGEGWK
jgi:hypothetical protein